jgi:hypothetical protein
MARRGRRVSVGDPAECYAGIDYARLAEKVREGLKTHINYLEWAQTLVIEQTLTIPVPVGTYDTILEPEDGRLWYLGYVEATTSANTTMEVYVKAVDGGGEALIMSVANGSTGSKDFKLDQGANARCVQLRLRTSNSGSSTENQTLVLRGVEVVRP